MNAIKTRILVVGLALPLTIVIASTVLMVSWLPTLPDVVAVHWSGTQADGFGSVFIPILLPLAITTLFVAFSVGSSIMQAREGRIGTNQKFLLVVGVWLATLLSVGLAGSLAIQRTEDAATPDDSGIQILLFLAIGAAGGIVLAAIAWFILPKADNGPRTHSDAEPFTVGASERLTWMRTARFSTSLLLGILLAFIIAIIIMVVSAVGAVRGAGGLIFASIVLVVAAVLFAATAVWRVTADSRGLIVRSWLGWPRVRVTANDIRSVRVVTVGAGGEFGGYGIRWGLGGRMGIILKAGPALEVTRKSGHTVLVTVDDAATAASVLTTYQTQDA